MKSDFWLCDQGLLAMSAVTDETNDTRVAGRSSGMTFCSVFAEDAGVDPAGSAWANSRYLMVEIPLPWPYEIYASKRAPAGLKDYLYGLYDRGISIAGAAFAPDEAWSVPGMTRIIDFRMPDSPLYRYKRAEYLVPTDQATDAIRTIVEEEDTRSLDAFRQATDPATRDLYICTHGAIDACCATYGYPMYKLLRHMVEGAPMPLRVWRCSHFGGHQYAATMLDMPEGRYWGHMKAHDLGALVTRNKPFSELRKLYRGWAAVPTGEAQIAETAAFSEFGWDWTGFEIIPDSLPEYVYGAPPQEASVTFRYRQPDGDQAGEITVDVIPDGFITSMHTSGIDADTYEQPKWRAAIRLALRIEPGVAGISSPRDAGD
jgi:hypothetical protein